MPAFARGRVWDEGVQFRGAWATFSLCTTAARRTEGLHMAFPAPDRQTVREFHQAAIAAGYRDNGGPGSARSTAPGTSRRSSSIRTAPTSSRRSAAERG